MNAGAILALAGGICALVALLGESRYPLAAVAALLVAIAVLVGVEPIR